MPTIKVFKSRNLFTPVHTHFCRDDETGRWYAEPEIVEEDGECVIFKLSNWYNNAEKIGKAVHSACLTVDEAFEIAKIYGYSVTINNRWFGTDQHGDLCAGFTKKRGTRIWLLPVTMEEAYGLVDGSKKITYWTNSRHAKIEAA